MPTIAGYAFRNYRSFGGPDFTAALTKKVNLIAGQNNSGKSNVLRAILNCLASEHPHSRWDEHAGNPASQPQELLLTRFSELRSQDKVQPNLADLITLARDIRVAFDLPDHAEDSIWLPATRAQPLHENSIIVELGDIIGQTSYSARLSQNLTNSWSGNPGQEIKNCVHFLVGDRKPLPKAFIIEGSRAITPDSTGGDELTGSGIIRRLFELQNPSSNQLGDRSKFLAVQAFVREVLEEDDLTISIPHTADTIHVSRGTLTLPIENIGTGIHEIVIIAAAATLIEDAILCVEEPELHLHPLMQRKLLRYLAEKTSNTYFIATHSAHMLDMGLGEIAHVRHDGIRSRMSGVSSASEQASVCEDLGYRPSDLVQSNAVIWVEGPSDRIYLKHWLDNLSEVRYTKGIHYSVMFYGGGLLNNLSPLDVPEVKKFISLRRLNRFSAIVIDSDKTNRSKPLNESKRRVLDEFEKDQDRSFTWVTWGYTIENYVPFGVLKDAVAVAHPKKGKNLNSYTRWQNPLDPARVGTNPSKVAIARQVIANWQGPFHPHIKREIAGLLDFLDHANAHLRMESARHAAS